MNVNIDKNAYFGKIPKENVFIGSRKEFKLLPTHTHYTHYFNGRRNKRGLLSIRNKWGDCIEGQLTMQRYNNVYKGDIYKILKDKLKCKKANAKRNGIDFDDRICKELMVLPKECPISGLPLDINSPRNITIDRIDPRKGYVLKNVWWVHRSANIRKGGMTLPELKRLIQKVEQNYGT